MSEEIQNKDLRTTTAKSVKTPRVGDGRILMVGFSLIVLFFGGFGVWAALAPIDSAAIAPGSVRIDSNRKTVQHLEGGIVAAILVRDGDVVRAGQELVRLDDTRAKATLELLKGRYLAARALEARLIAERDGRAEITFPAILRELGDEPNVIEATRGQTNIFRARQRALAGQSAILRQRIAVLREEIAGIRGKIAAQAMQMHLIKEEIKDVRGLYKKGLAKRARLLALERGSAKIEGDRSENRAKIARAGQQIAEADLRISELGTTLLNDVVQELRDVQTELFGVAERIRTAEDVFRARQDHCTTRWHRGRAADPYPWRRHLAWRSTARHRTERRPPRDRSQDRSNRYRRRPPRASGPRPLDPLQHTEHETD